MVQSQTDNSLILRRDPTFGILRWLIVAAYGLWVVFPFGVGLLLMPFLGFLFIGRSAQQIAINAPSSSSGNTLATITFTNGARKAVQGIVAVAPRT